MQTLSNSSDWDNPASPSTFRPGQSSIWCCTCQKKLWRTSWKFWNGGQTISTVCVCALISVFALICVFSYLCFLGSVFALICACSDLCLLRSVFARSDLPPTWPVWKEPARVAQSEKDSTAMQFGENELILWSWCNIFCKFGWRRKHPNNFSDPDIWSFLFWRLTSQLRASRTELRRFYKIALTHMISKSWSRFK